MSVQSITPEGIGNDELDTAIEVAGYAYDPQQDIFYSTMDPWQRYIGYCRLYDEAAPLFGMIFDCEPIHFVYNGKKWVIEFWKGQYDLVTGCEIGVYQEAFDLSINGLFNGAFYHAVSDGERLQMTCILNKNGRPLFKREGVHWWLTGFKLGEFSEPSELTMDIKITLLNGAMRDAFVEGLRNAGYLDHEYNVNGNTVSLTFNVPHTPQPVTRTKETDWLIQQKNKKLCEVYQEITDPYSTVSEKLRALEEQAPEVYRALKNLGRNKKLFQGVAITAMLSAVLLYRVVRNRH